MLPIKRLWPQRFLQRLYLVLELNLIAYHLQGTLTKEELLEVKRQLEEQYHKANKEDENIKQIFQFLWLDMILKGTKHGLWNIKMLFSLNFVLFY